MLDWFNFIATRVSAQTAVNLPDKVINNIKANIINPLIALMFAVALLYFLWGVYEFIQSNSAGGEKKEDGKRHMLWGIIGMAIMMSAMGIANLICTTIGCAA